MAPADYRSQGGEDVSYGSGRFILISIPLCQRHPIPPLIKFRFHLLSFFGTSASACPSIFPKKERQCVAKKEMSGYQLWPSLAVVTKGPYR